MKDRWTLHILDANYTNKYVTFNKWQCIGNIESSIDPILQTSIVNVQNDFDLFVIIILCSCLWTTQIPPSIVEQLSQGPNLVYKTFIDNSS